MSLRVFRRLAAFAAALLALAPAAHGQLFRAYLALDGSDANPCTLAQPCRLLPAALNAVASGGEIWLLDSANYNAGPVNVAKSVTILAVPGVLGSVVALGGTAITVATAGVKLTLRNLNIVPFPGNTDRHGIEVSAGASLVVQGCHVTGFTSGTGTWVTAAMQVAIIDSHYRDNAFGVILSNGAAARVSNSHFTGNSASGLYVSGISGTTSAAVSDSVSANNAVGFAAESQFTGAATQLSIKRSVIERNTQVAVATYSIAGASAHVAVSDSFVVGNGNGLRASGPGGSSVLVARGNTIVQNDSGLVQIGAGVVESAGGNTVRANGFNTTGTITNVPNL
jgi:hypothetical protein